MRWWLASVPPSQVVDRTTEAAETVREQADTVRRKAEELAEAAEALIAQNSDHVRGE